MGEQAVETAANSSSAVDRREKRFSPLFGPPSNYSARALLPIEQPVSARSSLSESTAEILAVWLVQVRRPDPSGKFLSSEPFLSMVALCPPRTLSRRGIQTCKLFTRDAIEEARRCESAPCVFSRLFTLSRRDLIQRSRDIPDCHNGLGLVNKVRAVYISPAERESGPPSTQTPSPSSFAFFATTRFPTRTSPDPSRTRPDQLRWTR
jgi:hypothetical protein